MVIDAAVNGLFEAVVVVLLVVLATLAFVAGILLDRFVLPHAVWADLHEDYRRWLTELSPLERGLVEYARAHVLDDDPIAARRFKLDCYRVILQEMGEEVDQPPPGTPPARRNARSQARRILLRKERQEGAL